MADSTTGFAQQRHLVKLVIASRIAQSIKALRVVGVGVQAAVRPEQPTALVQLVVDNLNMGATELPLGQRQPEDTRPLTAN